MTRRKYGKAFNQAAAIVRASRANRAHAASGPEWLDHQLVIERQAQGVMGLGLLLEVQQEFGFLKETIQELSKLQSQGAFVEITIYKKPRVVTVEVTARGKKGRTLTIGSMLRAHAQRVDDYYDFGHNEAVVFAIVQRRGLLS